MFFCIPPNLNKKIREAIAQTPDLTEKLLKMSSPEREDFFKSLLGDKYAKTINDRFVSKFNTNLDAKTIQHISTEMTKINELRAAFNQKHPNLTLDEWSKMDAPEWAVKYTKLTEDLNDVINIRNKMSPTEALKHYTREQINKVKDSPDLTTAVVNLGKVGFDILTTPTLKALKATMDASYALRQGAKVLAHSRGAYKNSWAESWKALSQPLASIEKSQSIMREFRAKMMANPYYDKLVEGKLAVTGFEETFETAIGERIPFIGRMMASSNNAFSIFSQSARMNLATEILARSEKAGISLSPQEIQDIAQVVNSITGRGSLGRFEASSSLLNKTFFAPRYVRSAVDTFAYLLPMNNLSPVARAEAFKNSRNTLAMIGTIMGGASMLGDVEWNPLSSNFGKVRVPNTSNWIDLTAGHGQYVTLAAREWSGKKTDSKGKTKKLGDPKTYKPETRMSILGDFAGNKLAPIPSYLKKALSDGELYGGKDVNVVNSLRELFPPITADNAYDYLTNEDLATALLLIGSDALGASVKSKY